MYESLSFGDRYTLKPFIIIMAFQFNLFLLYINNITLKYNISMNTIVQRQLEKKRKRRRKKNNI
jgi:hypothetical protein